MRGVKQQHLPEKTCAACGRPFRWRKSLAKTWDEVKYCSDACRRYKASGGKPPRARSS